MPPNTPRTQKNFDNIARLMLSLRYATKNEDHDNAVGIATQILGSLSSASRMPYSREARDAIERLRNAIASSLVQGSETGWKYVLTDCAAHAFDECEQCDRDPEGTLAIALKKREMET